MCTGIHFNDGTYHADGRNHVSINCALRQRRAVNKVKSTHVSTVTYVILRLETLRSTIILPAFGLRSLRSLRFVVIHCTVCMRAGVRLSRAVAVLFCQLYSVRAQLTAVVMSCANILHDVMGTTADNVTNV